MCWLWQGVCNSHGKAFIFKILFCIAVPFPLCQNLGHGKVGKQVLVVAVSHGRDVYFNLFCLASTPSL